MCFCLLLVVYTKIQDRKIQYLFLYQNIGCQGLQGIQIISIYISTLPEDMLMSVSIRCWWFTESLIFSTFSIQIFKNRISNFGFVPKNWLSRASGYYIYLYIQPFYYGRTAIGVLC